MRSGIDVEPDRQGLEPTRSRGTLRVTHMCTTLIRAREHVKLGTSIADLLARQLARPPSRPCLTGPAGRRSIAPMDGQVASVERMAFARPLDRWRDARCS
jgi:hypothetical protein